MESVEHFGLVKENGKRAEPIRRFLVGVCDSLSLSVTKTTNIRTEKTTSLFWIKCTLRNHLFTNLDKFQVNSTKQTSRKLF